MALDLERKRLWLVQMMTTKIAPTLLANNKTLQFVWILRRWLLLGICYCGFAEGEGAAKMELQEACVGKNDVAHLVVV